MIQLDEQRVIEEVRSVLMQDYYTQRQVYEILLTRNVVPPNIGNNRYAERKFRMILHKAMKAGEIDRLKLLSRIKPRKLPHVLRVQHAKKIVKVIDNPRDMICFLIGWFCGLRVRDTARLKEQDIELVNGTYLKVRQSKRRKDRIVTLPKPFVRVLKLWLDYRKLINPYSDYIVPVQRMPHEPDKHIDQNYINTRFQLNLKKAGLKIVDYVDKRGSNRHLFHYHSLRHSYATYRLEKGDSPQAVMAEMGHDDYETLQIYTHLCIEARQRATDKIYGSGNKISDLIDVNNERLQDGNLHREEMNLEKLRLEVERLKILQKNSQIGESRATYSVDNRSTLNASL